MRDKPSEEVERGRLRHGDNIGGDSGELWGAFVMQSTFGSVLRIISSGPQNGWEHVSVSCEDRIPTWAEMCRVKQAFWRDDECVMQLHPPQADYVNCHPNCLHLWRPMKQAIPRPPHWML